MKNKIILALCFSVVFYNNIFAQDSNSVQKPIYKRMSAASIQLRKEADSLYNNKQYLQAAEKHKALITEEKGKAAGIMWLNVASNYSLGGNTDSAIVYLQRAADHGYSSYAIMQVDPELQPLHRYAQWEKISQQVSENRFTFLPKPNREVILALDTVTIHDQSVRWEMEMAKKEHGVKSEKYQKLKAIADAYGEQDRKTVSRVLEKYGWLSPGEIGQEGNIALFIIIQHAPIEYQKKYYVQVKDAVDKNYMHPNLLSYIDDRLAVHEGKNQLYGTQMGVYEGTDRYFVHPIDDVEHIDERRTARGMESMKQYCSYYGIDWSLKYYEKELPKVKREMARQLKKSN